MAMVEIYYKCDKCGEEISINVDDFYTHDWPYCPKCGMAMRETARSQPDRYEVEQDQNERDRRY